MKQSARNYKRVVIKIGSSLLCGSDGRLDDRLAGCIVAQVAALAKDGREVVVVSSGAIALGMSALGLGARPKQLPQLQAAAAIGQNELMNVYRGHFGRAGLMCGQVLLTWEDIDDRTRFLNARHTLRALLTMGVVPVINENDTVSTDEIKFGDNDKLSALVAVLAEADLVIILSDVDGLLDRQKNVVRLVEKITPEIRALACSTTKDRCVGGMTAKLDAVRIAADSGIPVVIANGRGEDVILNVAREPFGTGTLFLPKEDSLRGRKGWIAFSAKPKGTVSVDDGARRAILERKSLLAVGVKSAGGEFDAGEIVSIVDSRGQECARGRVRFSSGRLREIMGSRFPKEVIHRDDIVVLN